MALADRYTLRGILLQPKLLYIASGETDDFGHNGRCGDNTAIFYYYRPRQRRAATGNLEAACARKRIKAFVL
jgi:hypothetical protein